MKTIERSMGTLAVTTQCSIGYIAIKSPKDSSRGSEIVWTFAAVPDGKDNIRPEIRFNDLMKYHSLRVLQQHNQEIARKPEYRKVLIQWDAIRACRVAEASPEPVIPPADLPGYDETIARDLFWLVHEHEVGKKLESCGVSPGWRLG